MQIFFILGGQGLLGYEFVIGLLKGLCPNMCKMEKEKVA